MSKVNSLMQWLSKRERFAVEAMRVAIAIVFLWIGWLKFFPYEADSISPFVANNPVMSHFYRYPDQYKAHLTREGELVQTQRQWQQTNNTYKYSTGLGIIEMSIGVLVLAAFVSDLVGAIGAVLAFLTSLVTLSFLVTTPEAWVPALGDAQHGFPYLSGAGRLVLKDVMLLAGALVVLVDSARAVSLRSNSGVGRQQLVKPIRPIGDAEARSQWQDALGTEEVE